MDQRETGRIESVTNIFNTHAGHPWHGPLPREEIRSQLIFQLFFSDTLLVPASTLICHPAMHWLVQTQPRFLEQLLVSRCIKPIITKGTQKYFDVYEHLKEYGSPAVDIAENDSTVQEVCNFLEGYRSAESVKIIDGENLRAAKSEVSRYFMKNPERILPNVESYKEHLVSRLGEAMVQNGVSGKTWYNLGKEENSPLRPYDQQLSEVGAMVYDCSYAQTLATSLCGHGYTQNVPGLGTVSETIAPTYQIEVMPGILADREIEARFYHDNIWLSIDGNALHSIRSNTQKRRRKWRKAVLALGNNAQVDGLLEAQERLNEYLVALFSELDSVVLERSAKQITQKAKLRSVLACVPAAQGALTAVSMITGAAAVTMLAGTSAIPIPWMIVLGAVSLASSSGAVVLGKRSDKNGIREIERQGVVSMRLCGKSEEGQASGE